MITKADIEANFDWGKPKEVATKRGPRIMLKAPATIKARDWFSANRAGCVANNVDLSEWPRGSNKWNFVWWQEIPKETIEARKESIEMSRQVDVEIDIPAPPGLEYKGFQKAGVAFISLRKGTLLADEMGLGKSLVETMPVLTPTGWVMIGSLKVGDMVIGSDGAGHAVTGVFPQGELQAYMVQFSDGSSVECSLDHLWTVRNQNDASRGRPFRTLTTRDIRLRLGESWEIPKLGPVQFEDSGDHPIPPYLLGVLIGDGCLTEGLVGFVPGDELVPNEVRKVIGDDMVLKRNADYGTSTRWSVCSTKRNMGGNRYHRAIKRMGLNVVGEQKFIPKEYLFGSEWSRREVLRGLMDTDGTCNGARLRYQTTSARLADDVVHLIRSLGGLASSSVFTPTRPNERPLFTVCFSGIGNPFTAREVATPKKRIRRTIVEIQPLDWRRHVCISVDAPDKLFVTRDFILTHNTIQIIGFINKTPAIRRVLIICPSGIVINWLAELTRWVVRDDRDLDVGVVEGSNFPGSEIVVIGMGMLGKHLNKMRTIQWDLVAIDEAHELRNPKTIKCQAVFGYRPKKDEDESLRVAPLMAPHRIAATGTPIWNKPIDMWPLIEWLDPIYWSSWWKFTQEFCGAFSQQISKEDSIRSVSGASNLERLQTKLRESVMIRRLKRDVLTDLPPKTRQIVALETDGSEAAAERRAMKAAGIDIEDKVADLKAKVELAKVGDSSEAYQAAVDALAKGFTAGFDEIARIRHETALAKVGRVVEYLKGDLEAVDKLVVFAHHVDVIQKIAQGLAEFGAVAGWGEHSSQIRQQIVNRFQNENRVRVAVLGLIPFGVGFTLTAANLVAFAELDWVPARILQCEDRLHRIGQQSNVLAKHLILEGTIDGHMAKTQVRKLDIMDRALDRQGVAKAGPTETDPWKVAEASEMEVPGRAVSVVRQEIAEEAAKLTPAQIKAVSVGLKLLASYCDGARTLDGAGFSKVDVAIGRDLANRLFLSPKQAALGMRILGKYKRQLPEGLLK
jgi:hypothetical protein